MLVLFYFNWIGTPEELKKFTERATGIINGIEGVKLCGIFVPTSEWNFVLVVRATSYDKAMSFYKIYMKKYGRPKSSSGRIELLHKFDEVGYAT